MPIYMPGDSVPAAPAAKWDPQMGNYSMPISCTDVPEAQRTFDLGLNLAFNFNQGEARSAFTRCAAAAPRCAMCYWGLAYAHAPFLNHPIKDAPDVAAGIIAASTAARLAKRHAAAGGGVAAPPSHGPLATAPYTYTAKEVGLIDTMGVRYPSTATGNQTAANLAYERALSALHTSMPDDDDVSTFLAEASLLLQCIPGGYRFYHPDGTPTARTARTDALLRSVFARSSHAHPYAHHLYIHLAEPSRPSVNASHGAGRSLPSAAALAAAFAGTDAQHLIHMPTHAYLRSGQYAKTVPLNAAAHTSDERYLEHGRLPYGPAHNVAFALYGACMAGMRAAAYRTANTLSAIYTASPDRGDGPGPDIGWNLRLTTPLRFGAWHDVIRSDPAQPRPWPYSVVVREYANGTALLKLGRVAEANQRLRSLEEELPRVPPSQAKYAQVARLCLLGALQASGAAGGSAGGAASANLTAAADSLATAASEQNSWMYDEPPKWHMPVRQCLGTVQLRAGQPKAACATFAADLRAFPRNAYSLYGMVRCMRAQPAAFSPDEVEEVAAQMRTAWKDADVPLTSACLAFEA